MSTPLGLATQTKENTDPRAILGPCADLKKMMTETPPLLDFVFGGLLKGTVGVLYGQGAVGKTFLLLQAGVMITAGVEMLGLSAPKATGRVVHISREDPEEVLHNRVHAIAQRLNHSERVRVAEGLDIRIGIGRHLDVQSKSGRAAIGAVCRDARLCVIDTLSRSHGADENSNPEMISVLNDFEAIARDTGCAIILAHHVSKAGRDGEGTVSGRGASGIGDNARWGASITKMSLKQAQELTDPDGPGGAGEAIGDNRDLYALLDVGVKPNYVAGTHGGQWLRREKGGVLVPANLLPFKKDEAPKTQGVGGVRRGLSNILGPGADEFDKREAKQYADADKETPSWLK